MCSLRCEFLNVVRQSCCKFEVAERRIQRLIIITKVLFFMCCKTKLKPMGLSRDCIFKTTCALRTYQTTVILIKFDLRFAGETLLKVHNDSFPCRQRSSEIV